MKGGNYLPNISRVKVKQPGAPSSYREQLVNRHLVEWGKEQQESSSRAANDKANALAWARTFLELNEVQYKSLEMFRLADRSGIEHNGVAMIPISPGSACLVFKCPYCGGDTASQDAAATLADLGRLIYEESEGELQPDQEHLRCCPKAPADAIREEVLPPELPSPTLVDMLADEIGMRFGLMKK